MPIPYVVARMNRTVLNRAIRHVATRLPDMGLVVHQGRRSGRTYRTPVLVFPSEEGYVFALTYGPNADWVRNVVAADGADLITRRRHHHLSSPRIYTDPDRRAVGPLARAVLRALRVADFMSVRAAPM